eukprot:TRINITY_DN17856_c0_g1_i2.p1 TRINITY_DN17856_c0_g1~~TRINITY_DN17856_c0_g1_i2.p1  ORF type:complete len:146 (+),score=37.34 TRINITY_DN17856_c0_g1_i2:29-466(+)
MLCEIRIFIIWCIELIFFFFKQKTAYEMLRSLVGSEMCIRDRLSWNGAANMAPASAKLVQVAATQDREAHDQLVVEFVKPYVARPVCTVQFQDQLLFAHVYASERSVKVSLEASCGCPQKWQETVVWLTIMCQGSAEPTGVPSVK